MILRFRVCSFRNSVRSEIICVQKEGVHRRTTEVPVFRSLAAFHNKSKIHISISSKFPVATRQPVVFINRRAPIPLAMANSLKQISLTCSGSVKLKLFKKIKLTDYLSILQPYSSCLSLGLFRRHQLRIQLSNQRLQRFVSTEIIILKVIGTLPQSAYYFI